MSTKQGSGTQLTLGGRAIRGGQMLAAGTVVDRVARLGRNMLLARILVPDDFALMAITLATIAVFSAITEVGVAQAVIQNQRGHLPEFLNVAWWFGVVRGFLVATMALLLAGPIAWFYDEPDLRSLLMAAPLVVVFTSLASPRVFALQGQFKFGATLWTNQGAGVLGTVVTIALGFALQNVWALVLGAIFEAFARFVLSFILCPIRPRWHLDEESRRDLFKFSRGMLGLPILTLLIMQADVFVLGRVVSAGVLGYYALAITLAGFPLTLFSKVIQPLVVPTLALFQKDPGAMSDAVLRLSRLVWLFGLPLAGVMATVSGPLLALVYGEAYSRAAPAFALYCGFTVIYMASMVSFSVYLAIARPELQRRFTVVRAIIVLAGLYPLSLSLGTAGAALTLVIGMLVAMTVQLFNLRRVIGLSIRAYLVAVFPGLLVALLVALPCAAVVFLAALPGWAEVLICAALGGICWALILVRERGTLRSLTAVTVDP